MKRLCLLLLVTWMTWMLAPANARAQSAPQLQVQADVDTVSVGDVVHLELTAQSGDGMPTDPQPGSTAGFVVAAPRTSPTQTHININGNRIDRFGLVVDWALQAQRVGVFSVGPPSVVVGGTRFAARPVSIRVVPAGQAPHPPQQGAPPSQSSPFGFSPFDPWRGLFPGPNPGREERTVTTDPKLALDASRGAFYFLHATVDSATVAVGQQVTFSVYEYLDEGAGAGIEVDASDVHDPTAAEFVKHPLMREDQEAVLMGYASVANRVWRVSLVRRWALFPLHAGDLTIGPMSVTLVRPRSAAGSTRSTETLHVHVTEPPLAGRPPGYAVGDVGHFTLVAQVVPRDVEQGGAVGVHVELSGTGNIPSAINPPARAGVEWLAPEVHEQLGSMGHDAFGGKRSFDYVVRMRSAGDMDLGEVRLPYWDPDEHKYEVAQASLGVIHVKPSPPAAGSSGDPAVEEILPGLPGPHDSLEGTPPARAHLDDRRLFWLLGVGAWPAAFGLAVAGRAAGRRFATAWHTRKASPATELRQRVANANAACRGNDVRAADAAIVNAMEAATVAHAGVSVRGAVGDEVVRRLEDAGVSRSTASGVAELLRECESARFAPEATDVQSVRDRWVRAQGAIRRLEKR